MATLRMISMMVVVLNFTYNSSWISTTDNVLADAASRFQYLKLFQLQDQLSRISSSMRSQITGIRRMLATLNGLHFTSGTDLLLAHASLTLARNHTSILLPSIPIFCPPPGSTCLPALSQLPSGLLTSPITASSTLQLNCTSQVCTPSTLTL